MDNDVFNLFHSVAGSFRHQDTGFFVILMWVAWTAGNHFLFKGKHQLPALLLAKAESIAESYTRVAPPQHQLCSPAHQSDTSLLKWLPPPAGWYKVNVDAALNLNAGIAGCGAVIRDSAGTVVAAAIHKIPSDGDVDIAEAEAVAWGIQVAKEMQLPAILVETDSLHVSDYINSKMSSIKEVFWVIMDIQKSLKLFPKFKVQFVSRNCNAIAHNLAKLALVKCCSAVWKEPLPSDVCTCFQT